MPSQTCSIRAFRTWRKQKEPALVVCRTTHQTLGRCPSNAWPRIACTLQLERDTHGTVPSSCSHDTWNTSTEFCGQRFRIENTLLSLTSLDTVVGETSSLRAISRNELPSLSISSISHLSLKLKCAPFFSGTMPSFPGTGERFVYGRKKSKRRKAPPAQTKRSSQGAGLTPIQLHD